MAGCNQCSSDSVCSNCSTGYILNLVTNVCDVQVSTVDNCYTTAVGNVSKC